MGKKKKLLFSIVSSFLISSNTYALELPQKTLMLASMAIMDTYQSVTSITNGDKIEIGPLFMSDKPTKQTFINTAIIGVSVFYFAEKYVPEHWLKDLVLDSVLLTEQQNIIDNEKDLNRTHITFIIGRTFLF